MYNVITFPNDPDKVFYNVTPSGKETSFPPWYLGHQNTTTKPMDIPSTAKRYGNRGAYAMKIRHVDRNSTRKTGGGQVSASEGRVARSEVSKRCVHSSRLASIVANTRFARCRYLGSSTR